MKINTHTFAVITFQCLLFGSVIFTAATLRPSTNVTPDAPVISPTTSVNSTPSVTQVSSTVSVKKTDSTPNTSLSPKHAEIIKAVDKEYVYHMFAAPNEASYVSDWPLSKINAPAAWDMSTGNGQTVIAVIDGGFALYHEDLIDRWYENSQETGMTASGGTCWTGSPQDKQTNNCDDDNNGYIDDWRGWNFILGDNTPQAGREDPAGSGVRHGTQVASLAGASTNNGVGIASLAWNTKIMPLQALDDDGMGYTSDVTAAVYYAVDNGADVINLSLGAYANDPAMQTAIAYATANNVVVVAAAGNCGDVTVPECSGVAAGTIAYPAAYPDVIAVGASTSSDQRAWFSSYGQALDVTAPGYAIPMAASWSASNETTTYATNISGTSFASPVTASLAALIKSIRPSTSVVDITALINATASKPSAMSGLHYSSTLGHGIINASSALTIAQILNTESSLPTLLQAGSYVSEHSTPANTAISSGCTASYGACTVQLTNTIGHKRFLPYATINNGSAGWTWSSNSIDNDWWEIRARSGENVSNTPYFLMKK